MRHMKTYLPLIVLLPAVGLVGCGGSGSGDGTSGSRTIGMVSSVNGSTVTVGSTSFDASGATVGGDEINSVTDVQPGMIVTVDGPVDDAANTGTANKIDYDAEVEGKVDSIGGGMMIVMGQNIDISKAKFVSKMGGVMDINNIPPGAMVEVCGYSDGMGNIVATYVKLEDHMADENDDMEVEGYVASLDLDAGTFMIGNQVIHFDPSSINLTLENGMNVEVDIVMDGNMMRAVEIELENDYGDDDDSNGEVEIEGEVTSDLMNGQFTVMGHACRLADNVKFEGGMTANHIVKGAIIEVEGYVVDGVLVVTEVGDEDESDDDSSDDDSSTSDSTSDSSSDDPTPTV